MKFAPARQQVFSSSETKTFNMAVNAKSFAIVSGDLYNNIVKAVIREYSTNAYDAHLEAGNDNPFDVHLPTEKEPYFYIRDYGVGLNEEQFEKIFFTYFESSKDNTNDLNGCLGLGAKCLFGTKRGSGVVESWKDDIHYIYSLFIGKSGIPEYTLLSKTETSEPNGVKIQIDVDRHSFREYEDTAKEVYQYFEQVPNFVGKKIDVKSIYNQNKNGYAYTDQWQKAVAVMGNVAYPIDKNYGLNDYKSFVDTYGMVYFFDIGDLNFTPSRESLKYTDRTIKNLKKKFEEVKKSIIDTVQSDIDNCNTEWEAYEVARDKSLEITNKYKFLPSINSFAYKGKTYQLDHIEIDNTCFPSYGRHSKQEKLLISSKFNYVINDLNIGAISRCQELAKSSNTTYLISQETFDNLPLTKDKSRFKMASSLPKPVRSVGRNKITQVMKMIPTYYVTEAWKPVDIKDITDKYYIIRNAYRPIYRGNKSKPKEIYRLLNDLNINCDIYGISKKEEKKFKKEGWIHVEDLIDKEEKKTQKEFDKNKNWFIKYSTIRSFLDGNRAFISKISQIKDLPNDLQEILDLEKDFLKNEKKFEKIEKIYNHLVRIDSNNLIENDDSTKLYKKTIEKYPLLGLLSKSNTYFYIYSSDIKNDYLSHYIQGVNHVSWNV